MTTTTARAAAMTHDDVMLELLINSRDQGCVLLLGPQFAMDVNGQKLHIKLRDWLMQRKANLDDEFDNMYISRESHSAQQGLLSLLIPTFYKSESIHPIYPAILKAGFSAIIAFTADHLLVEADEGQYQFDYFSVKGKKKDLQSQPGQDQDKKNSDKPIIFNLFGSIHDNQSMITSYDTLYEFLLNIMKADQEFPLELKNKLNGTSGLLFLGFDLNKWYIPLFVRKLKNFIDNNSVNAFACQTDEPPVHIQSPPEILNKYPLRFQPFEKLTPFEVIQELVRHPKPNRALHSTERALSPAEKKAFQDWYHGRLNKGTSDTLVDFRNMYNGLEPSYKGLKRQEFDLIVTGTNELLTSHYIGKISNEDFSIGCNKLFLALSDLVKPLIEI